MSGFWSLLKRDLTLAAREGGAIGTALGFFLLVVTLMPLGLGPDLKLLSRIAAGVLWIGLLLASLTGVVWMLPLALDAALDDSRVALAKFLSVPLLIGAPVALSWPRAGFVVRGVVLAELTATLFRLGWLYLISPLRLCSNYLLDDQQRLGKLLLAGGFAIVAVLAWKLMWGRIDTGRTHQSL